MAAVVVVTGSRLTDIADAYLMDPTVADRVVVVSALGGGANGTSVMGWPNGELDPWADWIVGQRFRYIQINGYYDQLGDVTHRQGRRPAGERLRRVDGREGLRPFSRFRCRPIRSACWRSACRPSSPPSGARSSTPAAAFDATTGPPLLDQADGSAWVVPSCDAAMAGDRLWKMLLDPRTFGE